MSMTWPLSKLDLINEALALTGNNLVSALGDGSDEDIVAGSAYEAGIEYMLDNHDWKQLTTVVPLTSTGIAPTDSRFDTAFAKPADCIHVIWVRVNQSGQTGGNVFPILYQILTNQIVVNLFGGGTVATPAVVTLKYVRDPGGDKGPLMLRTFMTALRQFVMAGIYRGLHEDPAEARLEEQAARALLAEARTRSDQEQPKRAVFNMRITTARLVRRPWPRVPQGTFGFAGGSSGQAPPSNGSDSANTILIADD
jgi:hypothetical protein